MDIIWSNSFTTYPRELRFRTIGSQGSALPQGKLFLILAPTALGRGLLALGSGPTLVALCTWTSCGTSLSLSVPTCKARMINTVLTSLSCCEDYIIRHVENVQ